MLFLAFAQCIRLLETRSVQVMVLFQLKLRKWKRTPSTYEWTLYPCVRHFVRWTFSPFLHPPTYFSTETIRSTQVTHPVLLHLGGYGGMGMYMGQGALSWRCKTHLGNYLWNRFMGYREDITWGKPKRSWGWRLDQTGSAWCPTGG